MKINPDKLYPGKLYLGGSFNPLHHGHLICARAAAEAVGAAGVVLVPTGVPPHKSAIHLAPPEHRLAMCALGVADIIGFEVDGRELNRAGPSFTIDTVRDLRYQGSPRLPWLIGADMLNILPSWREIDALLEKARFIIMARPGWEFDWKSLPAKFQSLREAVVPTPAIDISATEIRRRVAAGLPIDFLTPPAICKYIRDHHLYR